MVATAQFSLTVIACTAGDALLEPDPAQVVQEFPLTAVHTRNWLEVVL